MSDKWIKFGVVTTTEAVEPISDIMFSNGAGGIEIMDPKDYQFQEKSPTDWDFVEEEVLNKGNGTDVHIYTYFSEEKDFDNIINEVKERILSLKDIGIDIGKGEFITEEVNENDWANNWKQYYKPFKIGEKIVVVPTWEDYELSPGELKVELDPGMAFGTGTHETTSMCIEIIENHDISDKEIIDIGTGSGILAICAGKLGAKRVIATDLDEVAVSAAKSNIKLNHLEDKISVYHGNLADDIEVSEADIVVSNIIAEIIMVLCEDMPKILKKGGTFIASGIIREKRDQVLNKLKEDGFEIVNVMERGEWVAIESRLK